MTHLFLDVQFDGVLGFLLRRNEWCCGENERKSDQGFQFAIHGYSFRNLPLRQIATHG
jgi:hypothetical protein